MSENLKPLELLNPLNSPIFAKVRYRSQAVEVSNLQFPISNNETGEMKFISPVWGITPGQSVVLYQDNLVLGGGIINQSNV